MTLVKNIRLPIKVRWTFCLLLIALWVSPPVSAADKVFTDDDIQQFFEKSTDFKKSHSLMIQQSDQLKAILNGFLVGDTETINKKSDQLLKAMRGMIQTNPPATETESSVWQSMAEIVEETHLMKEEISKNDYNKAYRHFSNVSARCIQCHEAVREWGKLPKPEPEKLEPNAPLPSASAGNKKKNK